MDNLQQLQAEADALQRRIEADLRAQGLDPTMGDYDHPLNEQWKDLNEAIQAIQNAP
ncbi:hypothetical protein [Nonomuraea sp. NPDC049158]|uniref:hypothetical protein n=1 Tax=Nonomuraea sp. NPDC049158 TaxID=3155649 RepID=UPI0033DD4E60